MRRANALRAATTVAVVLALSHPASSAPGDVTIVAGGGDGTGAPATEVGLRESHAVAIGPDGNLYIGESEVRRIRRVDLTIGTMHTVARTGDYPERIAVAPSGEVYFATHPLLLPNSSLVGKIDPVTGETITVAGSFGHGFAGDGGPANQATLNGPRGITFDPDGNLYIADAGNHRVRKVGTDGIISTVAGNGTPAFAGDGAPATSASLDFPLGVAVRGGRLFIADAGNNRVRMVAADGTISTVAGGGTPGPTDPYGRPIVGDGLPATQAALAGAADVAVDSEGGIVIAELGRIRRVDPATGHIHTIALVSASSLAVRGVEVYAIEVGTNPWWHSVVYRIDAPMVTTRAAGNGLCCYSGNNGPPTSAELRGLHSVAVMPEGSPVWTEGGDPSFDGRDYNHVVRTIASDGTVQPIAGSGSKGGVDPFPALAEGSDARGADLVHPQGVAVDADGNLYFADSGRVSMVTAVGNRLVTLASGIGSIPDDPQLAKLSRFVRPQGIALGPGGEVYVADPATYSSEPPRLFRIANGMAERFAGGAPGCGAPGDGGAARSASLCHPMDVAVDDAGNVYVAEAGNVYDPSEGAHRIRRIDAVTGVITTIAGTGTCASAGDGGPAPSASLCHPRGIAFGPDGDLFIAQASFGAPVRRIDPTGAISSLPVSGYDVAVSPNGDVFVATGELALGAVVKKLEGGAL